MSISSFRPANPLDCFFGDLSPVWAWIPDKNLLLMPASALGPPTRCIPCFGPNFRQFGAKPAPCIEKLDTKVVKVHIPKAIARTVAVGTFILIFCRAKEEIPTKKKQRWSWGEKGENEGWTEKKKTEGKRKEEERQGHLQTGGKMKHFRLWRQGLFVFRPASFAWMLAFAAFVVGTVAAVTWGVDYEVGLRCLCLFALALRGCWLTGCWLTGHLFDQSCDKGFSNAGTMKWLQGTLHAQNSSVCSIGAAAEPVQLPDSTCWHFPLACLIESY